MLDFGLLHYKDHLQIKIEEETRYIFDVLRQKWLVLQPEEMVRQLMIHFLIHEKGYNKNRIGVEHGLLVNTMSRRYDILIYDDTFTPFMLIECKAPRVKLNEDVFFQTLWYNTSLKVPFLLMTNGVASICYEVDYDAHRLNPMDELPSLSG